MKKIFTLLLALCSLTTLFAQSGYRNNNPTRDVRYNSGNEYPDRNSNYNNNTETYDQQGYGTYSKDQQGWNRNDANRNYQSDNNFDDRRMQYQRDYGRRTEVYDRNIWYHNSPVYSRETRINVGGVAVGMILGGILGAVLSH